MISKELEKARKINKNLLIFSVIVIIVLGIVIGIYIYDDLKTSLERDYYKIQMINFCKITEFYDKEKYPEAYPCERWVLK